MWHYSARRHGSAPSGAGTPISSGSTRTVRDYSLGVPVTAVASEDWQRRLVVPDDALKPRFPREDLRNARCRFVEAATERLTLTPGVIPITADYGFDTWVFRTDGEVTYGRNLSDIGAGYADERWRGLRNVHQDAMCWASSLLRADFRYVKRNHMVFYSTTVRFERKMRSATGHLVAYQMLEAREIQISRYRRRYIPLPTWFGRVEVCQGCRAELPPVVTYLGLYLLDHQHGLWVVFLTEWAVKVASFILWDVYDTFRLWYLPPTLRSHILALDMTVPLGGEDNDHEVKELVGVITAADWSAVPSNQRSRSGTPNMEHNLGVILNTSR